MGWKRKERGSEWSIVSLYNKRWRSDWKFLQAERRQLNTAASAKQDRIGNAVLDFNCCCSAFPFSGDRQRAHEQAARLPLLPD